MEKKKRKRVLLLGAGGREFHNFNICFRNNPEYEVVGFTATQIPHIANRIYPRELAGPLYPKGILILPEDELPKFIKKYKIDEVIFAYSDISHPYVMHLASKILALGADFKLLGAETMIKANLPVIAVCAVRTGCGKSPITRKFAQILRDSRKKVVVIRHPMPYGNLKNQTVQRFQDYEDLDRANCTIEEREEYEPLIKEGFTVFAGVDYKKILEKAQKEADIIIWDGGNNDLPFLKPNLHIVVCDPLRPGHEVFYHPGETNLRMADAVIINKVNSAPKENVAAVLKNIERVNPKAKVIFLESKITTEEPNLIKNKDVLVVEDGPTVTHGEMPYGAGYLAARQFGAKKILEPKKWAKGEIKKAFEKYPHLNYVLPALGYDKDQIKGLKATIDAVPCQTVLSATPIDLGRVIKINKPLIKVSYEISGAEKPLTRLLKANKLI